MKRNIDISYVFVCVFTALFALAIINQFVIGNILTGIILYLVIGFAFWIGLYLKRRAEVANFRRLPQVSKFILAWIMIPHSKKVSDWVWENKPYWWKR